MANLVNLAQEISQKFDKLEKEVRALRKQADKSHAHSRSAAHRRSRSRTTHHRSRGRSTHHHHSQSGSTHSCSQSRTTHYCSRSRTAHHHSRSRTTHHRSRNRTTHHRSRSRTTLHCSRSTGDALSERPPQQQGGATRTKASREEPTYSTEFYAETSYHPSGHSDTPDPGRTISQKADTPPAQLAGHNSKPVGHKHCTGLQDRLLDQTTTEAPPTYPSILSRPAPTDHGRDHRAVTETSYRRSTTIRGVLLQPLLGSKEGRGAASSHQPESLERVYSKGTLQDGGDPQPERSFAVRELASQDRPKRCLFHNTHSPSVQKVPEIYVQRESLPVHLPSLRTVFSPMGIHQDPQTSHSNAATRGSKADSLHGRHTIAHGVEGNNSQSPNRGDIPIRKPGVYNQQKEICYEPSSNLRIPRSNSRLYKYGATPSPTKNEKYTGRSPQNSKAGNYDSPPLSSFVRHDECNKLHHPPSPIVLSPPTDDTIQHPREELSALRSTSYPSPGLPGRARMVGHQHGQVEWQDHLEEGDRPHHRLGCIPTGLGSILQSPEDRRSLVRIGMQDAHQLPQTIGCQIGNPDICKIQNRNIHSVEDRQYHSSGLHQPPWRNSLQRSGSTDKEVVDVVSREEHTHHSPAPTV